MRVRLLTLVVVAAACGGGSMRDDSAIGGMTSAAAATPTVQAPPVSTDGCPSDGLWHPCSIRKRFEMAGFVLRDSAGGVREAPLTMTGTRFAMGRSTLTFFYYPDARARAADEARLDTARYVPADRALTLRREATRVGSANLLVILRSTSDHQRERVADLVGAGPPQARAP